MHDLPHRRTHAPVILGDRHVDAIAIDIGYVSGALRCNQEVIHFFLQNRQSLTPDAPIEPIGRG